MPKPAALSGFEHVFPRVPHRPMRAVAEEAWLDAMEKSETRRVPFRKWALQIPEPKFGTLNFKAFPFQLALYTNRVAYAKEVVVQKCSQVGASAWLVRAAIFWPDTRGKTALYVMPTEQTLSKFSNQRVKLLITGSEYLNKRVPNDHVNNVLQRQIGAGFFNMSGSNSEAGLESVDADILALDEYDLLVQANVPRAEKRVSGPMSLGLIRRIGFPTIPGYGISLKYENSDQKKWMMKCESCGEWQDLQWPRNIDFERQLRVCFKCGTPVDVMTGQWVAAYPDRDVPGFHLSRLIVPNANIGAVIAESKLRKPYEIQEFWNRTLGLPYVQEEARLSKDAIAAAQNIGGYGIGPRDRGYTGSNIVTMGIDVASVRNLTVRISERFDDGTKRALWIGEVESFNDLPVLMESYGVHMACIDHLPEGRLARGFAEMFPGRVFIASYADSRQAQVFSIDPEQHTVSVRRAEAMDVVIYLIRVRRNQLPENLPEGYVDQMQAPVRFVEKDEMDKVTVGYRSSGADDYFHSEAYDEVAFECFRFAMFMEAEQRQEWSALDDHLEFERSHLTSPDEREGWVAGPDEGEVGGEEEDEDPEMRLDYLTNLM